MFITFPRLTRYNNPLIPVPGLNYIILAHHLFLPYFQGKKAIEFNVKERSGYKTAMFFCVLNITSSLPYAQTYSL